MARLHKRHGVTLAILGAAVVTLFFPLLTGEVLFWGTPSLQFYPWRDLAARMIGQGIMPLWNPLSGGGAPLLANYQSAILYPPNWSSLAIPTEYAMGWTGLLHLVWAGLGMMLFLERQGVGRLGQGTGALSFALNGYIIGRFGFLSITSTLPWIPWLLWALDRVIDEDGPGRSLGHLSVLGGVTGMLLLAGHAQTAFYGLALSGCYVAWRISSDGTNAGSGLRAAGRVLIGVAIGVGLAMLQLAPTYELMQVSQRAAGVERDFALQYSFWPWRFVELIAPGFFGTPVKGDYWGYGTYWEDTLYFGTASLAAAVMAAHRWIREKRDGALTEAGKLVPFLGCSLFPIFVLALGKNTPVFPWLFDHVPTFAMFQAPTRWMALFVFAMSALAGIGIEGWDGSERQLYAARLCVAGGIGIAAVTLAGKLYISFDTNPTFLSALGRSGVVIAALGGLSLLQMATGKIRQGRAWWEMIVLAALATDLVTAQWGLQPTIAAAFYRDQPEWVRLLKNEAGSDGRIGYLPDDGDRVTYGEYFNLDDFRPASEDHWSQYRASMVPNLNVIDDVASINNFDPLLPGVYAAQMATLESGQVIRGGELAEEGIHALQRLNVTVLLSSVRLDNLEMISAHGGVSAFRIPGAYGRAVLATCEPEGDNLECAPSGAGTARITEDRITRIEVGVESEEDQYLLLNDTYYPGWQAEVDGERAQLHRVNMMLRAVQVNRGSHTVVFRYRPVSIRIGAWISGVSAILLVALAAFGYGRRSGEAGENR